MSKSEKYKLPLKVNHHNSFIDFVSKELKTKSKSWEDLADDLNINRLSVRNWLIGHRFPSLNNIKRIADYLSIADPKLLMKGCERLNLKFGADAVNLILIDIVEKENIPIKHFWKDGILNEVTVRNTLRRGRKPSLKILYKFVEILQNEKVKNIHSPLDLIEFK